MKLNFRPGKERIRATFSAAEFAGASRVGKIDEEKGILHDVQINLMGEAKGHGIWLGEDFIDGVVEQGNTAKLGVKVRFGHPNMCADALGTSLGRAQNFSKKEVKRTDGTTCQGAFADVQLAEEAKYAPGGDLYKWTLGAAKNSPDTFGQSIVFTYADFYVVDKDGKKHSYKEYTGKDGLGYEAWTKQSVDGKRFAVLDKLLGTDFTDSPAATDGVFGADDLAEQASEMLDANPQILALLTSKPDTVAQFLERYNAQLEAEGKPTVQLTVTADPTGGISRTGVTTDAYNALLGKHDEIEKRLSGLQSAKDKELAQLKADFDAFKATSAETETALRAEIETLKAKVVTTTEELGKANAALSAEQSEHTATKATLAKTGEQLTDAKAKHAALVGGVLGGSPDGKKTGSGPTGLARVIAAEKADTEKEGK